ATNPGGSAHTVTAHVTTNASPTPGVTVTFTVTLGPNVGTTGTGVTNASGDATFTYTSNGAAGTDTIEATATLTGTGGVPTPVKDTATKTWIVTDPPITASGVTFNATEGTAFTGTVATFTDPDPLSTAAEYDATINWGDSSSSSGTIAGAGGNSPYTVSGSHTYTTTGSFTVTTIINDTGGSTTTATCTVTVVPFATETGGAFVIGDLEAGLGNHVTWWGSHWANINLTSGGAPPDAMKGFAEEATFLGPMPSCGGIWATDPGSSTPPPPSVSK